MMFVPILLVFVAMAAAAPTTLPPPTTPAPPYGIPQCARSECPVYTLLQDYGNGIIKRRIEHGSYAYKTSPTCNISLSGSLAYNSLHAYFTNNSIARTTPIVLSVNKDPCLPSSCSSPPSGIYPCCEEQYNLIFYLPQGVSAPDPPQESGVLLYNFTQPVDFYMASYSGPATLNYSIAKYVELRDYLRANNLCHWEEYYYIATYDAPWRPQPHLTEVYIPVKTCGEDEDEYDPCQQMEDRGSRERDHDSREGDHGGRGGGRGSGRGDRDGDLAERRERREAEALSDVSLIPFM